MTLKQEKFIMARLKAFEDRIIRLENAFAVSVMAEKAGGDGSTSDEVTRPHQTPSQSIEAGQHG